MSVAAIIVSSRRPIAGNTCLLFVFGTSITVMDKLLGGGQPTMISALGVCALEKAYVFTCIHSAPKYTYDT